jgi:hypothetical protein
VTVDLPQIERAARAAAGAVDVEPWRAGNQRRTDRWRPEHLAASGEPFVPAVYNALRFGTRSTVSRLPLGVDADVEPARLIPMAALSARAFGKPSWKRSHQLLADERPSDDWPCRLRLFPRVPEGLDDFGARWLLAGVRRAEPERAGHVGEVMLVAIPVDVARADEPLKLFRLQLFTSGLPLQLSDHLVHAARFPKSAGLFPRARRWLVVLERCWVYPGAGSGKQGYYAALRCPPFRMKPQPESSTEEVLAGLT